MLDVSETRLEKVKLFGATDVINLKEQDAVQAVRALLPNGANVTFEVAGVPETFTQSLKVTKPRGTVVVVSIFAGPIPFNPFDLTVAGVKIVSSAAYEPDVYQTTIDLMASGRLNVREAITGKIELENLVEEGFHALLNDKSHAKILVKLSGEQ